MCNLSSHISCRRSRKEISERLLLLENEISRLRRDLSSIESSHSELDLLGFSRKLLAGPERKLSKHDAEVVADFCRSHGREVEIISPSYNTGGFYQIFELIPAS